MKTINEEEKKGEEGELRGKEGMIGWKWMKVIMVGEEGEEGIEIDGTLRGEDREKERIKKTCGRKAKGKKGKN